MNNVPIMCATAIFVIFVIFLNCKYNTTACINMDITVITRAVTGPGNETLHANKPADALLHTLVTAFCAEVTSEIRME